MTYAAVRQRLVRVLEASSGMELSDVDDQASFIDLGLDSLFLTQASSAISREFGVEVTFRHLVETLTNLSLLVGYLVEKSLGAGQPAGLGLGSPEPPHSGVTLERDPLEQGVWHGAQLTGTVDASVEQLIRSQLAVMQLQLQVLGGCRPTATAGPGSTQPVAGQPVVGTGVPGPPTSEGAQKSGEGDAMPAAKGGRGARITRCVADTLSDRQRAFLEDLVRRYNERTAASKAYAQRHRSTLADPRTVSGFNPLYKDLVYPLVTNKSRGSRIWDLDGNEYVDYVCGFGPILFGHSPDFIADAVREQLSMGIETGPQSVLAGEVAELVLELTGHERCAFASTGSEAVLGAIRLARTVTGRNKVVVFEGAYHGIVDEVLYRKGRDGRALPGAPGIPREALANLVVLPWNDMGVIEAVRTIGQDLAAVLVEPVQSRLPAVQPKELLQALRRVCDETGAALIMDEMITGFRMHPGGAQSVFGVSGDLATYGKIVGGGFPLGIIAGTRRFMDALDGGHWQYGDESLPTIGVTYFAGTFVRHPIALAAARATLNRLKTEGPDLQATLSRRTGDLVTDLAGFLASVEAQVEIHHCASWFEVTAGSNEQFMPLFFVLMRLRGFHVQDGRPFFLTTAHSDSDLAAFSEAFKMSVCELIVADLLSGDKLAANRTMRANDAVPPVPGARLGRDDDGNPAWYVEDASRPGEYTQVGPVQTFH